MITLSNSLSFLRAPLAFLFLSESSFLRMLAVFLAMLTDSIDGYIARKYRSTSRFGAILDPAMDKFFVYFVLSFLWMEQKIYLWQVFAMVSRDFFLSLFGLYLLLFKRGKRFEITPVRFGKATTALQFLVLIGLSFSYSFSWHLYATFILLGAMAFVELFQIETKKEAQS